MLGIVTGMAAAMPLAGMGAVPLAGTGAWTLDAGETVCTLSRGFAAADGRTLRLIVRSSPVRGGYTVVLALPDERGGFFRGGMTASLGAGRSQDVVFEAYPSAQPATRIWRFGIALDANGLPENDAILTLTPSRGKPVALALGRVAQGWTMLDTCGVDLLKRWGVDPEEKAKMAQALTAVGDEAMFLRSEDYPAEAIRAGAQGSTRMLFTIGLNGAVTECRVLEGSGNAALDQASCAALLRRGRYVPATGTDGKPMVTHKSRSVQWSLPGRWETDAAYRRIEATQIRKFLNGER